MRLLCLRAKGGLTVQASVIKLSGLGLARCAANMLAHKEES